MPTTDPPAPVVDPGTPTLFEWPTDPAGTPGAFRRELDVEKLLAVERAAAAVVEPIGRLWRDLTASADSAVSPHSLDTVLRDALTTMGSLLSVNTVAILLANEAGDELMARAAIGLSEDLTLGLGIRAGQGMAGRVLASRQPLIVGDLSSIDVVNPVLRHSGLRSVVAVPLLVDDHPIGVMYAASYEFDRFTGHDADLLQVIADRLAAALDRVRLFEKERDARRHAEVLADRVGRMQRMTALLAGANTVHDAAVALVESLETSSSSWRGVWLRDDDQLTLAGNPAAVPPGWEPSMALDASHPLAMSVREGRVLYDAEAGSSFAVLPLVCRDGCAGALAVVTDGPHHFDPSERELLAAVVAQAAQAFERAQLAASQHQTAERARFFARAAQALAEADSLASTLDRLGELAVGVLGEICLIDVVSEDGDLARMVARHRDPARQRMVDRLRTEFPPDPGGAHPAVAAIRTGRSTWSSHMPDDFLRATTVNEAHFELAKALDFQSYLTVPIVAEGRVLGSVTSVSSARRFRAEDIAFAEELAGQVAAVVDNARRYELAFRTSQILQSSLLPHELPAVEGVRVDTRYLTANRGLEVGGDFYDMVALPSGRVLFAIGDVAGHDRGAAAQMGHLRSATRALAGQVPDPGQLVACLRWSWELLGFDRIATALVGCLDPVSGSLTLASAGHYPPLLIGPRGATFVPVQPNPPLGMPGPPPADWSGEMRQGQTLLCYTDGAIDERSAGSESSMARLAEVAVNGELAPSAVCDRIVEMLEPRRADDVALLAMSLEVATA